MNSGQDISTIGYVYVIFNEMYKFYGDDVYKIGKSSNVKNRLDSYNTGYVNPVELIFESIECKNYSVCEKEVHIRLQKYRMKPNREFFQVPLQIAIETINQTINELNELDDELLLKYHDEVKMMRMMNMTKYEPTPPDLQIFLNQENTFQKLMKSNNWERTFPSKLELKNLKINDEIKNEVKIKTQKKLKKSIPEHKIIRRLFNDFFNENIIVSQPNSNHDTMLVVDEHMKEKFQAFNQPNSNFEINIHDVKILKHLKINWLRKSDKYDALQLVKDSKTDDNLVIQLKCRKIGTYYTDVSAEVFGKLKNRYDDNRIIQIF
jgi:hypothetical protein